MYNEITIKNTIGYNSIFNGKKVIAFDSEAFKYDLKNENDLKDISINDKAITINGIYKYQKQELYIFSLFDGMNYYNGNTKIAFINYIQYFLKKYNKIILFGHNINYDLKLIQLTGYFIQNENLKLGKITLKRKKLILDGVVYIKYSNKKYSLEFLDSFNFFKTSLHNIALDLKLEKYADNEYDLSPELWNEYIKKNGIELCNKDTYIQYKLYEYMNNDKLISWGISGANSSFKTYLSYFLPCEITTDDYINEIAIKGYRGGRTENYIINENKPIFLNDYDINSLYPYVMHENKYSIKFIGLSNENLDIILKNVVNQTFNYLIECDYYYENNLIRLPILLKGNDGKLREYLNYENAVITGKELLYLIKTGAKVKIKNCYKFENKYLFKKYVEFFYYKKKNSKGMEKNFYKLLLNSLYGKFGQHKNTTEFYNYNSELGKELYNIYLSGMTKTKYNGVTYSLYNDYYAQIIKQKAKYSVLIAMEITANARLYNYDIQEKLGFENIFYTDTDSFFTNKKLPDSMINNELGNLKLEKKGYAFIYAPKSYTFINKYYKNKKIFSYKNLSVYRDRLKLNIDITLKGISKKSLKIDNNKYLQSIFKTVKNPSKTDILIINTIKLNSNVNDKLEFKGNEIKKGLPLNFKKNNNT